MRWKKIEISLFFIHNAFGYTSSASASSAPSPQGEGYEIQCEHWRIVGRAQNVI
jgi:hypothetical protein